MSAGIVLPGADATAGRLDRLEAENLYLRTLLSRATSHADAESERSRRLGRIVESERSAIRLEAERFAAERLVAEESVATFRRDLADGAARLADAEELNAQLRASEEFTRRILWTTTDFVKVLDLDGRLITVSENGPAVLGATNFAGLIGRCWADFWTCPESRAGVLAALHAARLGRPSRFQAMLDGVGSGAGTTTWWDIAVTPIDGADGRPERILAVSRDITELKQTEARQTLLMQELAHRMKNTLALIQAVAAQTLRNAGSLEAAGEALAARLLALAQAHDVLLQGSFASASLTALVDGAVALHGDGVPGRFRVTGPDLTLGPRHGMTLALMLHELGTNAAKYGALSSAAGHVAITWAVSDAEAAGGEPAAAPGVDEAPEGPRLRFRWEEVGGPTVTPPTRTGFGSRLIARSLAHSFGGTVRLSYPPTGAVLTIEAPLDAVAVDPAGAARGA
ncbi:HWE histidine kinase domain-containing protein [Methylobacterium sp. NEAU 140]|uniref:sensor histidine kinase n=1 Tax=Methylobacterium sp. NEAU 140 TaxID=3064945 RepID=UPI0027342744|nr:HWE histidine kinase domain-containing protein [Methylobacterium sp. NEAU 140]MDP4025716.1 HWE histidine kinase domain-containing protein [Methylobacterium sp. NEAU 140]